MNVEVGREENEMKSSKEISSLTTRKSAFKFKDFLDDLKLCKASKNLLVKIP